MSELNEYYFSELYEMSSGISSKPEQAGHGHPFISFSIVFNNYYLPELIPDLMNTSEGERNNYSVNKGDVFLTRTSETIDELGMSSVALKDYPNTTFSGFLKRLRPKSQNIVYHKYIAFYLRGKYFRKTMSNNSIMTLRASLNEQIFSYLRLVLPPYSQQVKIGDFLFLLYQKIELNNKINDNLEQMAKAIYDYWFVQFDFPDENGKPYKSSGGKMVWNEEVKNKIPKGWEVKSLESFIASNKNGDWGKEELEGNYTTKVECIRGTDINGISGKEEVKTPVRYILEKNEGKILSTGDLVIEISGGSPVQSTGRLAYITNEVLERFANPLICSNFCKAVSLTRENLLFYFIYSWNKAYDNGIFFGFEGKTSGIKNLLFDTLVSHYQIVEPTDGLLNAFQSKVTLFEKQRQKNLRENQQLSQLRDWLLPMLMNGQVKID